MSRPFSAEGRNSAAPAAQREVRPADSDDVDDRTQRELLRLFDDDNLRAALSDRRAIGLSLAWFAGRLRATGA
jgi:hypothetical protein